jgi:acetyl esterase/lipase
MLNQIMKNSGLKSFHKDLNRLDLTKLNPDITEIKDLNYIEDNNPEHRLDVYLRKDGKIKPILIDIHGGGFMSHDKSVNRLFGNAMAEKGYVVFNLNYRLAYPTYNVFDQIVDIDAAVRWIVKHAADYEADADSIYIAGHSSAGVEAVVEGLLCVDPAMLKDFGLENRPFQYKGIVLDCGLMHFYKKSIAYWGMRNMVFPKGYEKDKRYSYMRFEENKSLSKLPPVVLITNSKDELKGMTYYFKEVLDNAGVKYDLIDEGTEGHMGIIFTPYNTDSSKVIDDMQAFFEQNG